MRGFRPLLSSIALLSSVIAWSPSGLAQEGDSVAAAQFDKGLADMSAGDYASACPSLAESYRLDPRPGTLFTMAECEAKWGKVASSYTHYDEYLQMLTRLPVDQRARQKSRVQIATAQRDALKAEVPMLTIVLAAPAPSGAVVKRDNLILGTPSIGVALPVDPGEHVLSVELADGAKSQRRISLNKGDHIHVELTIPPPAPVIAPRAAPRPAPNEGSGPVPREWTYAAFGVGAAGLVVGGITGALVFGKKSTVSAHCEGNVCDREGLDAANSGKTLALVSTISAGVGIAGVATGVALLLMEPSKTSRKTARGVSPIVTNVGSQGALVGLQGAW